MYEVRRNLNEKIFTDREIDTELDNIIKSYIMGRFLAYRKVYQRVNMDQNYIE